MPTTLDPIQIRDALLESMRTANEARKLAGKSYADDGLLRELANNASFALSGGASIQFLDEA